MQGAALPISGATSLIERSFKLDALWSRRDRSAGEGKGPERSCTDDVRGPIEGGDPPPERARSCAPERAREGAMLGSH